MKNEKLVGVLLTAARRVILLEDSFLIYKLGDGRKGFTESEDIDYFKNKLISAGVKLGCSEKELVECRVQEFFFGDYPTEQNALDFIECMKNGGEVSI